MATDDIYRGPLPPSSVRSLSSHDLSSSSSSSFGPRATLGALAAVVEKAITRWARRRGPPSISSSASSSSRSSIIGASRSAKRSRRSRSSLSQSESGFTAHLALVKARKEARHLPRQFSLYLPPAHEMRYSDGAQSITVTDSLSDVLKSLDSVLRKPFKARHAQERPHTTTSRATALDNDSTCLVVHAESASQFVSSTSYTRAKKGKGRANSLMDGKIDVKVKLRRNAWYLDVASPSWEDLRALGKLLHLHPLTLEDILQQEPREKLEIFPKLGYYLISFRAIEPRSSRDRTRREDHNNASYDEAPIGEANVYLAVFRDGICSFHFTDISDWIAYEALDSIVDSFFPYLDEIDKEVVEIEKLVFSRPSQEVSREDTNLISSPVVVSEKLEKISGTTVGKERDGNASDGLLSEKVGLVHSVLAPPALMKFREFDFWKHLRRSTLRFRPDSGDNIVQNSKVTLRRIARARRLVTSLSRLLATKYDVVAHLRKRLLINSQPGIAVGTTSNSLEIAMYMGDMQDHIYTLQHSLAYYERMLSQLHPTYLSQLRADLEITRSGKGDALLSLSVITVAVLCIQTFVGIFSLNVTVPHNPRNPSGSYHIFGVVMGAIIMILIAYGVLVWCWCKQAKLIHRTRL